MRRPAFLLVPAVLLATAGCAPSVGSLGPAPTAPPASPTGTASPAATPAPAITATAGPGGSAGPAPAPPSSPVTYPATGPSRSDTLTLELWYVHDGRLEPTRRVRPAAPATSRLTLAELAAGPTPAEAAAGLGTSVPTGIAIAGLAGRVETLTVTAGFDNGGTATVRLRQAQVVYSLTQFPTVDRVVFRRAGRPDSPALDRTDFADLLPPIVVTAPGIGETVPNPVTVTGTADVFEATVNVRILDAAGRQLAAGFTVASCGSGCRGDYRLTLGYRLPPRAAAGGRTSPASDPAAGGEPVAGGPPAGGGSPAADALRAGSGSTAGRIEVFEVSARDGSRVNLVSRPVRLTGS
ncbi:Gmad2 immunoglobulin-like domain-containing protein [Plantactinospora siamensis]|uniref:Gmad2 immunoglobulin-like domain-containing protein n=1 Tax=Plantactinospora siamensis TaxID=555372 RepID=A0ABV6NV24_9ACTN